MQTVHQEQALAERPRKGDVVETTILDVGDRDTCFGKLPGGLGVFVQGSVVVGDRVRATVFKVKKSFVMARMESVLDFSPTRVEPRCTHFGVCGGCKWQHVDYEEQLRLKRKRVQDALEHIGAFDDVTVGSALAAPDIFHYRNKVEFSFAGQRYLLDEEKGEGGELSNKPVDFALGFHAPRFYEKVVDVDACHIATPDMNVVLATVKAFCRARELSIYSTRTHDGFLRNLVVRQAASTGELMVNLVTSWHEQGLMANLLEELQSALEGRLTTLVNNISTRKNTSAFGEREVLVHGPGVITETLGGYAYAISANSFFQTNTKQAEILYEVTRSMADLDPGHVVYDLYSGTGTIALSLSGHCARVLGLEMAESAVADAVANAERNGVKNCQFLQLDLKDMKKAVEDLQQFGLPDVVVVDPPRAGVHPKALQVLLSLGPRRVVYVSCNPASLARDAGVLCEDALYRLDCVTPVDMFPHTNHIECVARLDKSTA